MIYIRIEEKKEIKMQNRLLLMTEFFFIVVSLSPRPSSNYTGDLVPRWSRDKITPASDTQILGILNMRKILSCIRNTKYEHETPSFWNMIPSGKI